MQQADIQEAANRKRSEAAAGNQNAAKEPVKRENSAATTCGTTVSKPVERASTAKAAASNTNRGTVERMDRLVTLIAFSCIRHSYDSGTMIAYRE